MKHARKKHMTITANIKKTIAPLDIVFPSRYGKLYAESARSLNLDLTPEELLDSEMLSEKVVQHVIALSSCADKAIKAIESEDKKTLQAVLAETKALHAEIDELQKIIYEDTLTKCYNRKWFEDMYLNANNHTLRSSGTMVIVDLNKFKSINDSFGHIVGDKVLVHISGKLKETGGNVIRYGGDEFLVIFDMTHFPSQIKQSLDEMIESYSKSSFKVEKESFKVSFAYGLVPFTIGSDLYTIIDIADKEMYRNKKEN